MPLFLFLVWLLWLRLPVLCWIGVIRVSTFISFLILVEKLPTSLLNVMLAVVFLFMTFIMLTYILFIPNLLSFFLYHERVNSWILSILNFVKCSFYIYWEDHDFYFSFNLLICICWTIFTSQGWAPLDNGVWSMVYNVLLNSVC